MNKKTGKFIIFFVTFVCAVAILVWAVLSFWPKNQDDKNPINSSASGSGLELFDSAGNYKINKANIVKGNIYSFFGYEWYMVAGSGDVATFWMVKPMNGFFSIFDTLPTEGSGKTASTLYNNGYTNTIWQGSSIGASSLRTYMQTTVVSALGVGSSGSARGKQYLVLPKNAGTNSGSSTTVTKVVYKVTGFPNDADVSGETMTANYSINSGSDLVWLPSWEEVGQNGTWGLTDNKYRGWTMGANDTQQYAWLRSAFTADSRYADAVGYQTGLAAGDTNAVYSVRTHISAGIRPAVHLNISSAVTPPIETSYTVTWENYDGRILGTVTVNAGTTPTYTGTTPTRPADDINTYTFAGWTPPVTAASANVTYRAIFNSTPIGGENPEGKTDNSFLSNQTVQIIFIVVSVIGALGIIIVTLVCIRNSGLRKQQA
jgi:hypothetical protein